MTEKATDTHTYEPANPPLALKLTEGLGHTRQQVNAWMADAGWQNSATRQADLDKVERVVRAAKAEERERCAKLCDNYAKRGGLSTHEEVTANRLADILRA